VVLADSHGISRAPCYLGSPSEALTDFGYGAVTPYGSASQRIRLSAEFVTSWRDRRPVWRVPQHRHGNGVDLSRRIGLGWTRFARRYSGSRYCFTFLGLLRCFSSPRWPRTPMDSAYDNSGTPGSTLVWQLPQDFRSLPRPSSPSDTKTSPIRP